MKQVCEPTAAKILVSLLIYSLLILQAGALNCVNVTGYNLQCPDLSISVPCLEIGPMSIATTPYDLLCDGVPDCSTTMPPADEGNPSASPGLLCGKSLMIRDKQSKWLDRLHAKVINHIVKYDPVLHEKQSPYNHTV